MYSANSAIPVSLCLLTWNEIEGCKLDVPNIPPIFDRVFAIDNSSTDGTIEYLEKNGIAVIKQVSKSYNGAYLDAIKYSNDTAVVFFHPKGTIKVDSLFMAAEKMRQGVDFLLASRISSGAQNEEDHHFFKPRKWFVIFIAIVSKIRWGLRSKVFLDDPLHGYRGTSAKFMSSLSLKPIGITADVEMIKHAYTGSFSLQVYPVKEIERPNGDTHFPAISTGRKILKYVLWGDKKL